MQITNSQINSEWKDPSVLNRDLPKPDIAAPSPAIEDEIKTPLASLKNPKVEDHASSIFYRRLVKFIFNRDKFEVSDQPNVLMNVPT